MRNPKYSLTEEQFQELREKLAKRSGKKLTAENIDSAYSVMVSGISAKEVCEQREISRQNLHRIVRDLWSIAHDLTPPSRAIRAKHYSYELQKPKDWVEVKVALPIDKAKSVQKLEESERAKLTKPKG